MNKDNPTADGLLIENFYKECFIKHSPVHCEIKPEYNDPNKLFEWFEKAYASTQPKRVSDAEIEKEAWKRFILTE